MQQGRKKIPEIPYRAVGAACRGVKDSRESFFNKKENKTERNEGGEMISFPMDLTA